MNGSEIAVVGMAARLPGSCNVKEFWRHLREGAEAVTFLSDAELIAAGESTELLADPRYVKAYAALEDIDRFDAGFFGFSPQDAAVMDPQHRILLEVAWEALENAGHNSEAFSGSVGVFATCGMNSYMMHNLLRNRRIMDTVGEWLVRHTGNDMNFLATRLSYEMNLKGPSMNVQTACSSALVAIHLASQSLLTGECDMALAGGCTLNSIHRRGYLHKPGEILSPDGHCRPFDQRAAGTIFGNGAGMVVLRRLADALADGDRIAAVVLGSAINNDGSMKAGYLAPSVEGQAKAITEALAASGVDPETVSFVEAHGTGTNVGDPIEVAALTQAYRRSTKKKSFCALGSVKGNIGHLGEAAGTAGLIKTVLALEHRQIPPTLHFDTPNPQIDFDNSPFFVNSKLADWSGGSQKRRAGVTALGAGGTNCHVILEESPKRRASGESRPWQLLPLSAAVPAALDQAASNLAAHLKQHPEVNLADAAYTLSVGRKAFEHRRFVVCRDREEAIAKLETGAPGQSIADPSVAFLFTGQGSQYPHMGWELYRDIPGFRKSMDECATILKPELGIDLRDALYRSAGDLTETRLAQPALFTIEYAMARLWMSWGVKPQAMIGHSVGEFAAACVAGVFSLPDALELVAVRGKLMQQMPAGAMLIVPLPADETERQMNGKAAAGRLSLAAVNAPALSVVAGSHDNIAAFEASLAGKGVECQRLHTSHAFHSAMMDPVLEPFRERMRKVALHAPQIPLVSNVTGAWMTAAEATDPEYWVQHLRKPVRFADGVAALLQSGNQVLLEVGPGHTLSALARQQPVKPAAVMTSLRRPAEKTSDLAFLLNTCGQLWSSGVTLDWPAFWEGERRHRIELPTYAFQRQSYWIEPDNAAEQPLPVVPQAVVAKADISDWFYQTTWKKSPAGSAQRRKQTWLVFLDETGLGEDLMRKIAAPAREQPSACLNLARPGEIESLEWIPQSRRSPARGEVAFRVHASALNFADVLKATGAFKEAPFGMECAGVVTAVGQGVTHLKVGDEVVAIGPGSFPTEVVRDARCAAKKPESLSFEDAVTLPAAYMTAWHALVHVGELKRGERVLIHAAAGGVGLAAVEIARRRGAEIFATAGNEEKRAYLMSLGVEHVFGSRTLDFADEIRGGVDVVLNSLTGQFIPRSLALLRPKGRFLEIGKKEILTAEQVPAGIAYTAIDLFRMLHESPDTYGALLNEVMDLVRNGHLSALPRRTFAMRGVQDAFQYMLQTRHTGKVVMSLEESPPEVICVRAGKKFERRGEREFVIRPAAPEDYEKLLESLGAAADRIDAVAHLWNVTPRESGEWDQHLDRGFFSLTELAKALGKRNLANPVELCVISNRLHDVAGETSIEPAKATLTGPCRVIPREFEDIRCRSIDIDIEAPGLWQYERLLDQLETELESDSEDRTVAYRGADRWMQSCEPVPVHGSKTSQGLRPKGVYLITGGMGGIGLELAEHLAKTVQARLILVGRTLPNQRKLDRIRAFEKLGAQVLIARADVTDVRQMRRVAEEAEAAFGPVHGVFHAAGVLDDGLIAFKAPQAARAVMAPKIAGALVLEEVFGPTGIDFLILFSSVSSALGLEGQVDYTAANAFLDAFAQKLSKEGRTRVVAIGWGAWKHVGMAAAAAGERVFRKQLCRDTDWLLAEHAIKGSHSILPGIGYLELIRSAVEDEPKAGAVEIRDVILQAPFIVPSGETKELVLEFHADSAFTIRSEQTHVTGKAEYVDPPAPRHIDIAAIRERCNAREVRIGGFLPQSFMDFGPRWANVVDIRYGREEALISSELPEEFRSDLKQFRLHPALLDMATGGAQPLIPGFDAAKDFYVPFSYGRLLLLRGLPSKLFSHVRLTGPATFDVTLVDEHGEEVAQITDFVMRPMSSPVVPATPVLEVPRATGMLPHEGLEALDRVLRSPGLPHVMISPLDLNLWLKQIDEAAKPKQVRSMAYTGSTPEGNELEQRLSAMWSDILGIESVGLQDDFFQLGGHSLLLVRLVSRIEKEFKKTIPLSSLFQSATIEGIAALLRDGESKTAQFFVPFNDRGSGPALYCVHSVGGDAKYHRLAELLGPEQRLFGIQIPPELRTHEFTASVEGMASRYVEELLAFQPEGPYLLGGYSAGASVALEMAQQLRARGRAAELLVAIDGAPFRLLGSTPRSSPKYYAKVLRNFPRWVMDDLAPSFSWKGFARRVTNRLARLAGKKEREKQHVRQFLYGAEFSAKTVAVMESFYRAVMRYDAQPYNGKVLVYTATTEPLYDLQETDVAWRGLASELEVVPIRATHKTVVDEVHFRQVATHLRLRLSEFRS